MRYEKSARLLDLARHLAGSAEGWTLEEIAAHVGCNRRTAERMRDALRLLFPAMDEVAEGSVKRFRITAGLDGFMQAPTAEEIGELHAAAAALERAGGAERAGQLRGLAEKLKASLRQGVRARLAPDVEALTRGLAPAMQAGPRPLADAAVLGAIWAALKAGAALRFGYGARSREVFPWGLIYGRAYYLVGPERGMGTPVLWRLDRMVAPELGGAAVPPPEGWSIGDYAARSFGVFQEEPMDVVLRFSAAAAGDAGRFLFHPSQEFLALGDGGLEVRFRAGGVQEMVNHLFGWGTEVTVVEPVALRLALRDRLAAALAHHR
jgi:predicted DNA-binding transcriptional regulator YafY